MFKVQRSWCLDDGVVDIQTTEFVMFAQWGPRCLDGAVRDISIQWLWYLDEDGVREILLQSSWNINDKVSIPCAAQV